MPSVPTKQHSGLSDLTDDLALTVSSSDCDDLAPLAQTVGRLRAKGLSDPDIESFLGIRIPPRF